MGSPLLGAFLLMEASGLAGPILGVVLVPGLLAAGIGSLIFTGLDNWTGLGTYLPVSGPGAARGPADTRRVRLGDPRRGDGRLSGVLFSGETSIGPLLADHATYSLGALLLLVVFKSLAYSASLSAFRGGPVFPSLFVGGAGGLAMSHLPGLDATTGFALGMGALSVAMLKLPMTAVLLATLLLGTVGLTVMPLVIVVAYVLTLRLAKPEHPRLDEQKPDRPAVPWPGRAARRRAWARLAPRTHEGLQASFWLGARVIRRAFSWSCGPIVAPLDPIPCPTRRRGGGRVAT
ncbi:chloride channel protein [Streptomyces sp. NPDC006465]|uniref:chloride channel protein n=1 Tax=Streptomyces sp. NPDC006465 TaxID=3157174 RepID=UPI0033B68C97